MVLGVAVLGTAVLGHPVLGDAVVEERVETKGCIHANRDGMARGATVRSI